MSRNLRLAHLPGMHTRLRFSGYLTVPSLTDAKVADAISSFLSGLKLWRDRSKLPADWPTRDDTMVLNPPPGLAPIWGEGDDVSAEAVIGDPETPWRLVVSSGQLVIDNVWLYDAKADPWPEALAPCPSCPPCMQEKLTPPVAGKGDNSTAIGVVAALFGAVAGGTAIWVWRG